MQNRNSSLPGTVAASNNPAPGTAPKPDTQSANQADQSGGSSEVRKPPSVAKRLAHMLETGKPLKTDEPPPAGAGKAGEEDGSPAKPKKFNELAERLGVEIDELYGLEIANAADGSPVTVQTLKDHHSKRSEFSVAQLQWEEARTRQQSELVRGNAEIRELLSAIPRDKLDPKILETVRAKVAENAKRERARTLELIPDWRDEGTMTKELEGMSEFLKGYGFPPDYLKTVFDHRAILMMRDAWRRETRVRAVLDEIEQDPPPALGKGKPQGKAPNKGSQPLPKGRAGLESLLNR